MAEPMSWLDIPIDLTTKFLHRLPAHVDRVRFAAVCQQWHASAQQFPLPPPLPMLALPDGTAYSLPSDKPFRFHGLPNYKDACGNWLVFSGEDNGSVLKDPFSNATVTLPALNRVRIRQHLQTQEVNFLAVQKPMLCSPHLAVAFVRIHIGIRIAVCKPGATSWWCVFLDDDTPVSRFVDIAFHKGNLYAIDVLGGLFTMDVSKDDAGDPWVSRTHRNFPGPGYWWVIDDISIRKRRYLVESRGVLLLVVREIGADGRNKFEVFQADFDHSRWTEVTTLGDDQLLFLHRRCCRSVCVSQTEMQLLGDCIVFLENDYEYDDYLYNNESSCSCSVYSMKNGSVSTLLPTVSWKRGTVLAAWLFPQD